MSQADTASPPRRGEKFVPEVRARLLQAIRGGANIKDACGYAGINKDTYYDWRKRALGGTEEYPTPSQSHAEFLAELEEAEPAGKVAVILGWIAVTDPQHPKFDWRANRDFLARRFPDEWAERSHLMIEDSLDRELIRLERELEQKQRRRAATGEDSPTPRTPAEDR